jgi:HlyD family secretion protein
VTEPVSEMLKEAHENVRTYMRAGLVVIFVLLGGFTVWASRTQISGAVLASGVVAVESYVKKVQHPHGGVVAEIFVKGGSKVAAGDLLIRLDETVARANLQMVTKQLDELVARANRLEAERDAEADLDIPASLAARQNDETVAKILSGENTLFVSRRDSREGQKSQLRERIGQLRDEVTGIKGQISAKAQELQLIERELQGIEDLERKKLVTTMRVMQLRREAARLRGEKGQLDAMLAQTHGRITETELQILRIEQDFRTEIVQDLRDNQARQAELIERRIAAEDQLKRIEIRSPQDGIVHELAQHTVGGVINPSETIMRIVPEDEPLIVEAKVEPQDIDQVLNGDRKAYLRFAAFDHQQTPEIEGRVKGISADLIVDQATGHTYYLVRVSLSKDELAKLDGKTLVPGMPTDVHIKTQDRTALSYLFKPFHDQMAKAFRER